MDGSARTSGLDFRAFQRRFVNESLRIRLFGQHETIPAVLSNYSKGGLYLATPYFMQPGTNFNIEMPKHDILEIDVGGEIDAKVIWSWKQQIDGKDSFAIGARWFSPRCDCCDEPVPCEQFYQTREGVTLCPECRRNLEKEGSGRLEQSVYRYLLGNVV
jgi:hypothetical protein